MMERKKRQMDHRIQRLNYHPYQQVAGKKKQLDKTNPSESFQKQLQQVLNDDRTLKISKHAQKRLTERNISFGDNQWSKIEEKVLEAKTKGVKDSLVITNKAALVVSAQNNTVITAMHRNEASSQIFTNIDGTILLDE